MTYLGIDIGGTRLKAGLVDENGRILRTALATSPASRAPSSGCFRQHSHSTTAQPLNPWAVSRENTPPKSTCPSPKDRNRPTRFTQP